MDPQGNIYCARCRARLGDEQVHELRGNTGLSAEQLSGYNLRMYCDRCSRFRKRKSGRMGYVILVGLLMVLLIFWAL
ncbi:MAG: hypothetical protein AB8C95_16170 [Phycisphaeraceae bacterium]